MTETVAICQGLSGFKVFQDLGFYFQDFAPGLLSTYFLHPPRPSKDSPIQPPCMVSTWAPFKQGFFKKEPMKT